MVTHEDSRGWDHDTHVLTVILFSVSNKPSIDSQAMLSNVCLIVNISTHFNNYVSHSVIMVEWLNITEVMTWWFCSVNHKAVERHAEAGGLQCSGQCRCLTQTSIYHAQLNFAFTVPNMCQYLSTKGNRLNIWEMRLFAFLTNVRLEGQYILYISLQSAAG